MIGLESSLEISHTQFAIFLALMAAFMHAGWNAMVKGGADKAIMLGTVMFGHLLIGLVMIMFYNLPLTAAWPYLAGSTIVHCFYCYFLFLAYRLGDLSQVYPIARGLAPVLVALGGYYFASEYLHPMGWAAVLLVSFGIFLLSFSTEKGRRDKKAIAAAIATGISIASYSILDGLGARKSGDTLGYIGYLFVFEGLIAFGFFYYRRKILTQVTAKTYLIGLVGGVVSAAAYGLVIYAKTLAPLGVVSTVREVSVIIASLIGVLIFKERPWKLRIAAAFVVLLGVFLLSYFAS